MIQAESRKSAEIKKLYADLIARVTLRTVAEAFDIAPRALVDGIVFNGYVSNDGSVDRQAEPVAERGWRLSARLRG